MRTVTAKELRALLQNAPDDAVLVIEGSDHSYQPAAVQIITGLKNKKGQWTEDHGEDVTPEKEYGKRLPIIRVF